MFRLARIAVRLAAAALTVSSVHAQYGNYGHNITTTPAQRAAIQLAADYLAWTGESVSNLRINNANLKGNLPAAVNRNADGSVDIGIDFARLEEVVAPDTPGAPGHPGLLVILLFHELQHLNHGWCNDTCCHAGLVPYVASKHCEFICAVVQEALGPTDALCEMYTHIQELQNSAENQEEIEGCAAGPTGSKTIPDCNCCAPQ